MSASRKPTSHFKPWQRVTLWVIVSSVILTLVGSSLVSVLQNHGAREARFELSVGEVSVALHDAAAPRASEHLAELARSGFYSGRSCYVGSVPASSGSVPVLYCGISATQGDSTAAVGFGPVENVPHDGIYRAGDVVFARQSNNEFSMSGELFIVYEDIKLSTEDTKGYSVVGTITGGFDLLKNFAATHGTASNSQSIAITIKGVNVT